jgi:hypothetical protein
MKKIIPIITLASIFTAHAQFTAGNLVVEQLGTGASSLTSAGTPIFIDEFTTAGGAPVQSISIPSTGGSALTDTGTGTSDGSLTRSTDGSVVTFAAYNAAAGTASVASAAGINRAVGVVTASGQSSLASSSSSAFLGNNTRSAVSDGHNYWATGTGTGSSGGLWYSAGGAAPTQITTAGGNFRNVNIFNGNLYDFTTLPAYPPARPRQTSCLPLAPVPVPTTSR